MNKHEVLKRILARVADSATKAFGSKLNKIFLYGSCARGDDTPESDVDIMIVLDCDFKEVRGFRDKAAEISSNIGLSDDVVLSILLRDRQHFEKNIDFLPFYKNIVREGVKVYG